VRVIMNGLSSAGRARGPKHNLVLAVGRLWDEGKNLALTLAAAPHLPWPVYVAGDTGGAPCPSVARLGRLSQRQLGRWYARASIFVLPARYEPFGLSALEAALSGCALVLGDIPSLREVWGDAAMYVEPSDVAGLVATVSALAGDPIRLRQLAARATARAACYPLEATAVAYHALYRDLVRSQSTAGVPACAS
jgi:glycosyltransferase involved in cell wall biosynthesis